MHHANLIVGTREWGLMQIPELSTHGTDRYMLAVDRLLLAHAQELVRIAPLAPQQGRKRIFVILCETILADAQHALLKVLEEPPAHAVFFLVVPREDVFIPTLRSRLLLYGQEAVIHEETSDDFQKFCVLSVSARLAEITKRLDVQDVEWINNVLRGYAQYAQKIQDASRMQTILHIERYFRTQGASKKMLLEHLALSEK